ncbi:MAG: cell division protein FtsZ [Nitrososphaerota archaeon]|nr:cell division protein FtsZ [Candidatus Calditenuaceae archaeon]MDW8072828.1 cell division protein FtsZ [Nitrososphaerota archaeon]
MSSQEIGAHEENYGVKIKLIGLGGAGSNTVHRLISSGLYGATAIAANTDRQHLDTVNAHQKILLGPRTTRDHGAGGNPEIGRMAAEESIEDIKRALEDADLVFIAAGLGGGTGTGAAPVCAKVARELGAIVVGVVTMPFRFEGGVRKRIALKGLSELQQYVNTVVVVDNNRLLELYPQYNLKTAFALADEVINNMILSITESIVKPSLINIDFEDFKTVVSRGRLATLGIGRSSSPNRAEEATFNALQSPLFEGSVGLEGVSAAIVHVTGGEDMKLKEASRPPEIIYELMGDDGLIVWGARVDNYYNATIQVSLILAGLETESYIREMEAAVQSVDDRFFKRETVQELPPRREPITAQRGEVREEDELDKIISELGIKRLRTEKATP